MYSTHLTCNQPYVGLSAQPLPTIHFFNPSTLIAAATRSSCSLCVDRCDSNPDDPLSHGQAKVTFNKIFSAVSMITVSTTAPCLQIADASIGRARMTFVGAVPSEARPPVPSQSRWISVPRQKELIALSRRWA